jgi:hypothetical protein
VSAQDNSWRQFVNSFFLERSKSNFINLGGIDGRGNSMTKTEALKYVYDGDSARLHCEDIIFDMETETVLGTEIRLNLPRKCLRLETDNFILIGYAYNDCKNYFLKVLILNKEYQITDSMMVCKGDDYGYDRYGLFNPSNAKLIMFDAFDNRTSRLYRVNEKLKFELIKEQNSLNFPVDDLNRVLDRLGWKEEFTSQ